MKTQPVSSIVFVAMVMLLFSLMTPLSLSADESPCTDPSNAEKWAVILSPGPQQGVPWGGYHVTITGYSNSHACQCEERCCRCRDLSKILAYYYLTIFQGKSWHLHGNLPDLRNWKGVWTQVFPSSMLDGLAQEIENEGFDRIKGPHHASTAWHISLTTQKKASKEIVTEFKHDKVAWYLWLVPWPGKSCQVDGTDCPLDRWKQIEVPPAASG